eukprot:g16376.t1
MYGSNVDGYKERRRQHENRQRSKLGGLDDLLKVLASRQYPDVEFTLPVSKEILATSVVRLAAGDWSFGRHDFEQYTKKHADSMKRRSKSNPGSKSNAITSAPNCAATVLPSRGTDPPALDLAGTMASDDGTEGKNGGEDDAAPTDGAEGVYTRNQKDLAKELLDAGITDADATEAVEQLRSKMIAADKINGQERWMVDLEEAGAKNKLGEDFMEGVETAVETLGFVLQALAYSIDNVVDAEKLTLLLSAAGDASQVLHKDQSGQSVQERLMGSGSGTRARAEPAPYTGLCAFGEPVYLHVIEASHQDFMKDEYDWSDTVELIIPPGYGILFHSCLVHAGSSYHEINGRLHIYFRCKNGRTTFDKTFHQVKHDETKQPPARRARTGAVAR